MRLSIPSTTAIFATLAAAQSFTTSCKLDTVKVDGRWLTAECNNILRTASRCTKLDLNNCLKNNFGRLEDDVFGTGPHYADKNQCVNCTNKKPSGGFIIGNGNTATQMTCQCNPGTGVAQANWPTAVIDLDVIVTNNNGVLECHQTKGTGC